LIEEYKEFSEKQLSQVLYECNQFIYEQQMYEDLNSRYNEFRTNMFNEQMVCKDLIKNNKQLESDFYIENNIVENLQNQNIHLKNLVNAYKSRKIVKIATKIINIYSANKSYLKRRFTKKKDLSTNYNRNKMDSEVSIKHTVKNELKIQKSSKTILPKSQPKKLKNIKIAVILDEFSYNSFKHEFNAIPIKPSNWLEIFQTENPDIFLCESGWSGGDWQGKIEFDVNTITENRAVLLNVLKHCKEKGIPTIFWNKEDPTNHESFFDTALKFDHIFTTDEECVNIYKEKYGHSSVYCLLFAAQQRIFNPIKTFDRSDDVIFAGSWYGRHKQRSYEMIKIFDNILNSGLNLKIYDRFYEFSEKHPSYRFPDKYGKYINPPVPHDQIEKVYKESKYALNINTVTKSRTMFARRAFELMLCNTLVLSNYSKGLYNLFGGNVVFIGKNKIMINDAVEKQINNLYNVLKTHTYSNRFKQILDAIEYDYLIEDNTVNIYYNVNNESEIEKIMKKYESINYSPKKLTILLSDQITYHKNVELHKKYENNNVSLQNLNSFLNHPETISNDTPYFIFADIHLQNDFIEKAILHFSYIESEFGIALGDKFIFKKVEDIVNVLFSNENFMKAFKNLFNDNSKQFPVYTIQI
jgi:hypothetical protein